MKTCFPRMARLPALAALFAALAALPAGAGENDVLYWMVDDTASVKDENGDNSAIAAFFQSYDAPADSWFAARVRVTGGNITDDTFLSLYYRDEETGLTSLEPGELGMSFNNDPGAGYWGAGVPDGNQSPAGAYSSGTPEYSFIVEIGNVTWDESSQTGSWTSIAASDAVPYSSLGDYLHAQFGFNPTSGSAWVPTQFTAVPEPSGGLLAVFGAALLALRRRRYREGGV